MIWPFSKFAKWAEEKAVKDAMTPEQRLALAQ